MELGGKNPIIVCEDADIEGAIPGTLWSAFVASGQTCVSGTRFLVHDKIYDRFVEGLAARADQIKIGDPMDETTQMGPVISQKSKDRCLTMIAQAKADGAQMVAGAGPLNLPEGFASGFYVRPTVFRDVEPHHELFLEEVFGPVLTW